MGSHHRTCEFSSADNRIDILSCSIMTGAKHTKPMGVKKEKQMANPVRASTTKKAKDAAKVAMKKASKKPNKENVTSSTATAQLHAKPSQQKDRKSVV